MTWNEKNKKIAIKVIGTVESGLKYDAINYNDPITIGIGQWFGTRAAGLLAEYYQRNKATWDGVNNTLVNRIKTVPATDSSWNSYYVYRSDGAWLQPYLVKLPVLQDNLMLADLDKYLNTAKSLGMDVDNNTEAFIMWACAYHQSPRQAMRIINNYGPSLNLDQMHKAIMADGVLGRYANRYNTALAIIKSGDTSGVGSQLSGSTQPAGNGIQIGANGQQRIRTSDRKFVLQEGNYGQMDLWVGQTYVPAHSANGHYYWRGVIPGAIEDLDVNVPQVAPDADGGGDGGGGGGGGAGDGSAGAKALAWMKSRIMKFRYRQAPGRLDPDRSGFGDCSSTIYRAYMDTSGINPGTWTGDMYNRGTAVIPRGRGAMSAAQQAMLKPGDVIVMSWGGGYPHTDHVEMFVGPGQTIGHGGDGPGPHINNISMLSGTAWWTVRRHG